MSTATTQDTPIRTKMNESSGTSLLSLPWELRRRILDFVPLVYQPIEDGGPFDSLTVLDSLTIDNGKVDRRIVNRSSFSSALFFTCRLLSLDARKICFRYNRFRFTGSAAANLEMLKKQPKHLLELIRDIEFVFDEDQLFDFCEEDGDWVKSKWPGAITFVRDNLNVSNFTFSIDASSAFLQWATNNEDAESVADFGLPEAYQRITEPLKQLSACKALFLYWPVFHDLEHSEEARVMGEDYDAYAHGKTLVHDRAPGFPRGVTLQKDLIGMLGYFDEGRDWSSVKLKPAAESSRSNLVGGIGGR